MTRITVWGFWDPSKVAAVGSPDIDKNDSNTFHQHKTGMIPVIFRFTCPSGFK